MNANRLRSEYKKVQASGTMGIRLSPIEDNILEWECEIEGPKDTPYEGGVYSIRMIIPQDYPFHPPKAYFNTPIFHPNIHLTNGSICLNILKESWSPLWGLESVLVSIQVMLSIPNYNSPLNCDAANLIRSGDMVAYNSMARLYNRQHAIRTKF